MRSNTVEIDVSERPSRMRFAPSYNVAVPFIDRHISEGRGAKVAIRTADSAITYADLAANVDRSASGLIRLGLQRGDRMLMVVKDCPAFFYLFWGAIKAGIVPVPLNTLPRSSSYAVMIDDSSAAALLYSPNLSAKFCLPSHAPRVRHVTSFVPRVMSIHSPLCSPIASLNSKRCWQRPKTIASGSTRRVPPDRRKRPCTAIVIWLSRVSGSVSKPWAFATTNPGYSPRHGAGRIRPNGRDAAPAQGRHDHPLDRA